MTRIPVNYELFRRSMYVSKAWQAHLSFTPEEVAHVTMLNKRVAELTECSLEYAVAEALRVGRRYQKRKSAVLRRYIIKSTVSLGLGIKETLKSCPEHGCHYPDEACKLYREGGKYCLDVMLKEPGAMSQPSFCTITTSASARTNCVAKQLTGGTPC